MGFKYMSPERIRNERYDYSADVWSVGLVLMYLATGRYPYPVAQSYIDMVQTILESPPARLPGDGAFTPQFKQVVANCVVKDASARLRPQLLLGAPWFARHGATNVKAAVANVKRWIH